MQEDVADSDAGGVGLCRDIQPAGDRVDVFLDGAKLDLQVVGYGSV